MDVMRHMGLGDPVGKSGGQPCHHGTQVTQQAPIVCRQCAPRKGKLGCAIVWQEGVGVLEEGDQDDPVIDPIDENKGEGWGTRCRKVLTRGREPGKS